MNVYHRVRRNLLKYSVNKRMHVRETLADFFAILFIWMLAGNRFIFTRSYDRPHVDRIKLAFPSTFK